MQLPYAEPLTVREPGEPLVAKALQHPAGHVRRQRLLARQRVRAELQLLPRAQRILVALATARAKGCAGQYLSFSETGAALASLAGAAPARQTLSAMLVSGLKVVPL